MYVYKFIYLYRTKKLYTMINELYNNPILEDLQNEEWVDIIGFEYGRNTCKECRKLYKNNRYKITKANQNK